MFPNHVSPKGDPLPTVQNASTATLTAYGGSKIDQFGTYDIECTFNSKTSKTPFYITNTQGRAIIGLPTALDLKLVTLNCSVETQNEAKQMTAHAQTKSNRHHIQIDNKEQLLSRYPDCFDVVGKFQGDYHITLDPNVAPVIHPPRRVA